jgi:hypothetical protein
MQHLPPHPQWAQNRSSPGKQDNIQKAGAKYIRYIPHYKLGRWAEGIPIFGKKHSSLQSIDIRERIWKVAEEGDFLGFFPKKSRRTFLEADRSENI